MADLEPVIQANEIKTDMVKSLRRQGAMTFHIGYEIALDALTLSFVPDDEETAAYFIDDYVAYLYRTEDLQLAGLYIEDFEQIYLDDMDVLRGHWLDWHNSLDASRGKPTPPASIAETFRLVTEIIQSVHETRGAVAPNLIEAMT